jgi:hypothetical protein
MKFCWNRRNWKRTAISTQKVRILYEYSPLSWAYRKGASIERNKKISFSCSKFTWFQCSSHNAGKVVPEELIEGLSHSRTHSAHSPTDLEYRGSNVPINAKKTRWNSLLCQNTWISSTNLKLCQRQKREAILETRQRIWSFVQVKFIYLFKSDCFICKFLTGNTCAVWCGSRLP